ncbi:uncharacterized protein OCT59_002640 [Rhizophagus irregularis]|nr:hypothetical protein OCT59_002640 [Rhizophagus irregularis]
MEENSLDLGSVKEIIIKNFENWTSGNKKIDNFIQEKQLKFNETAEVFEWIPHSEIIDIKEIGDKCLTTAIWKEGPLHDYDKDEDKFIRKSNKKVVLRYLHNSHDATIGEIANKVESYLKDFQVYGLPQNPYQNYGLSQNLRRDYILRRGYGLSQNPDTNDHILIFSNNYLDYYCEKCGNKYRKDTDDEHCIPCQVNQLKNNWTCGNEIIDNFIQEKQSEYNEFDAVFVWISYSEFIDIKEIEDKCLTTAIWKEGPLHYDKDDNELIRNLNEKVVLRYLHNSRDIKEIINKVESYLNNKLLSLILHKSYGLSRNPVTNDYILIFSNNYLDYYCEKCGNKYEKNTDDKQCIPCQVNHLKNNWTSGNEIIDNFIQEKQSVCNENDAVFEWISYNEFIDIEEIEDKCLTTAIWKEGPLHYDKDENKLIRKSNKRVVLKYLHNSQYTKEIINKVESYLKDFQVYGLPQNPYQNYGLSQHLLQDYNSHQSYGLSQNPVTNDCILIYSDNYLNYYCEKCGNKYRKNIDSNKQCLPCQVNHLKNNWTSGNEIIDNFIQEKQSEYNKNYMIPYNMFVEEKQSKYNENNTVFEWISYSEFIDIKELGNKCLTTAMWKEGPLHYDKDESELIRKSNKRVVLRYLHNSQDTREIINKVESYTQAYIEFIDIKEIEDKCLITAIVKESPLHYDKDENKFIKKSNEKVVLRYLHNSQDTKEIINKVESYSQVYRHQCYGLSQNPDTNDYILIFSNHYLDYYCEKCGNEYRKNTDGKQCITCQVNHLKNNWTSGNKIIDNFIQEKQSKCNENDTVFEWISYSEFINIKEIEDKCLTTAIWKEGPLHYDKDENKLIRKSNERVVLNYLYNSRDTEEIINKVESYSQAYYGFGLPYQDYDELSQNLLQDYNSHQSYGLSQNPDTNDYILIFSDNYLNYYCEKCGNNYRNYMIDIQCIPCQINHLKNNWTSGNEIIDNFIQKKQLKCNENDALFEWIPYSEIIDIREIGDKCLTTAIWKEGPLYNDRDENKLIRKSYDKIVLRYLYNSQDTREIINKVKSYLKDGLSQIPYQGYGLAQIPHQGYGLSQNPDTNDYILIFGNIYLNYYCEKCGNQYNKYTDVFEWIPYSELIDIKEIGDKYLTAAIWKEGPLYYNKDENKLIRKLYEKVVLRYLHDSRDTREIINKVKSYLKDVLSQIPHQDYGLSQITCQGYGLSQNPDTNDYILIFNNIYLNHYCEKCGNKYEKSMDDKWCKPCQINHLKNNFIIRTNENEIINNFIQEKQLNINKNDTVFEWISYSDFINIKEIGDSKDLTTAIWKEGPLHYDKDENKFVRISYENVVLRYLHNSRDAITGEIINKVESYLKDFQVYELSRNSRPGYNSHQSYGLSQNLDTNVYILVFSNIYLNYYCEKCGNKYEKNTNDKRCNSCKPCQMNLLKNNFTNWTSKNEIVDNFIQERQLNYNKNGALFEWIPYNELIDIKEIGDKCLTRAIWKNGPLHYDKDENKLIRKSYEKVVLRYLYNLQDVITGEIIDEIKSYLRDDLSHQGRLSSQITHQGYGLSQNPDTNDYILIFSNNHLQYYCEKCGGEYIKCKYSKWCKLCQINYLKSNFTNWTSGNERIDDFIQKKQLKYNDMVNRNDIFGYNGNVEYNGNDIIFEWIPFDRLIDVKEIRIGDFAMAKWIDGPLYYSNQKLKRMSSEKVLLKYLYSSQNINNEFLNKIMYLMENSYGISQNPNTDNYILVYKCLHNSQNFIDEFINEVKAYPKQKIDNILKIYGISQNPNTKDYIMVLEYAEGGNFNNYLDNNYESFDWLNGLKVLTNIISGLSKIHQNQMVHRDFHIGNILFVIDGYCYNDYNACISDMGLCRKIDDIDETSIYGVIPYVAPEVLRGKPYSQAADIYSFDADNRPNSIEIKEFIELFYNSLDQNFKVKKKQHHEIEEQFKETQESRKENLLTIKNNKSTTHAKAIYTSRLLNPFTKILSEYDDNINNNTVEITDFANF